MLAYTIDDDLRGARKIILPLIFITGGYEYLVHTHPEYPTVIDLINSKIPIFIQKKILKTILTTLISIIRTKYLKRKT